MATLEVKAEFDEYELKEQLWSGAEDTMQRIIDEDKASTFFAILSDLYIDELPTLTQINDLLRFEEDQVFEWCGINNKDIKEEFITISETDCNCLMVDEDIVDYLRKEVENSHSGVVTTDLYSIESEIGRDITDEEAEELIRVGQ